MDGACHLALNDAASRDSDAPDPTASITGPSVDLNLGIHTFLDGVPTESVVTDHQPPRHHAIDPRRRRSLAMGTAYQVSRSPHKMCANCCIPALL
jgi:hypothetical protein